MDIKDYLLNFYIAQNGENITEDLAKGLVDELAVTDGSDRETGEKWDINTTTEVGTKIGINFEEVTPAEWYLIINMMYSDYCVVGRKYGHTDWTFYADLAAAWFNDVDAKENKTFKYFFC